MSKWELADMPSLEFQAHICSSVLASSYLLHLSVALLHLSVAQPKISSFTGKLPSYSSRDTWRQSGETGSTQQATSLTNLAKVI